MANRVHNKLEVIGSKEHIRAFLDKAIQRNGDMLTWRLSNTILNDESQQNVMVDRDWYEQNLGTKWDSSTEDNDVEIAVLTDSYFKVYFDSAWSPPHIWLEKMINQYPNVNFKLYCTEEMLQFTVVLYNDENGLMAVEEGKYVFKAPDGREVYMSGKWLYVDTNEPLVLKKGEHVNCISSVSDYTAWFEK